MRTSVVEAVFAGVMDAVVLDGLIIPTDRDSVMRARMNVVVAGQVAHAREAEAGLKLTAEEPALRTVQLSRWTSDVLVATTALPRHASMGTPMNRTCETCCISSMPSSSLRPEPQMSKVEQR